MAELTTIQFSDPFDFDHPHVKRVIERVTAVNRKVTPQDCEVSNTLRVIACWYAAQYDGTFEYMVSMRGTMDRRGQLSPAQASGTINCMMNDYRFAQRRAQEIAERQARFTMPEADLPADLGKPMNAVIQTSGDTAITTPIEQAVLNGTYTIVLSEAGEYRTLRLVDAPESYNKPAGTQIAQYLSGSDNESSYTGFAFVFGNRVALWKKFAPNQAVAKALYVLLASDRQSQIDMGEAYAIESGNCFRCGRKLTVPASLKRGLGPICAEMFGL